MALLIFFFGGIAAAWWLLRYFGFEWAWWLKLAFCVVIGQLLASWTSLLLALMLPSTSLAVNISVVLCAIPLGAALLELWLTRHHWQQEVMVRGGIIFALLIPVLWMFWLHAPAINATGGLSTHGYTWGDLPLHMTLAAFFQYQPRLTLELPLLPDAVLNYPFLIDWQTAVWRLLGASWASSVAVPGALLFLGGMTFAWELARRLLRSAPAATLQLILFLGLGSAGAIGTLLRLNPQSLAFWADDLSNQTELGFALANPVTSHFFPQRSFLFGFALLMVLLVALHTIWQKKRWKHLPALGGLMGLLLFAHAHSSLIGIVWFLIILTLIKESTARVAKRWSLVALLVTALPQLWWFWQAHAGVAIVPYLGWMRAPSESFGGFWLNQLGFLLVAIPVGLYFWRKGLKDPWVRYGLASGALLLIVGNFWLFHVNPFDNLKFMLYGFWLLLLPAAYFLRLLSKTWALAVVPVFLVAMTLVGYQTIARDLVSSTNYELFSQDDIQAAADLQAILPTDARVATVERHTNVIAALMGRRVLAGYAGWLFSYGLPYEAQAAAQNTIIQGNDDGSLAAHYGVTYIAVQLSDSYTGAVNLTQLDAKYHLIYNQHGWMVYAL